MSTFLVVIDALISSSQRRFKTIDDKLKEFEDLLLSASVKGLTDLTEFSHATEIQPIKTKQYQSETLISKGKKSVKVVSEDMSSNSPPLISPVPSTKKIIPEISSNDGTIEITEELEVEDLAALAFRKRESSTVQTPKPKPRPLGSMSLKMDLMTELKKKFGAQTKDTIDTQ
jgi:hypothetical protein